MSPYLSRYAQYLQLANLQRNVIKENIHISTDTQITEQKNQWFLYNSWGKCKQDEENIFVLNSDTVGKGKVLLFKQQKAGTEQLTVGGD